VLSRATTRPGNSPATAMMPRMPQQAMPTKMMLMDRGGLGAGAGDQGLMLDGYIRVPDYVEHEDAALWRRIRAEMLASGKHDPREIDQVAAKYLEERRGTSEGKDVDITPEMQEAERRHAQEFSKPQKEPR
jgi:hypothetical protein